jgi:protein arginine kinase activator
MNEASKAQPDTCQECGAAPATVHVRRISAGEEVELRLCLECAQARGLEPDPDLAPHGVSPDPVSLLFKTLGQMEGVTGTCPGCGMSYSDFRETGRLGCSRCYKAFLTELRPLIRRVHGEVRHVGKVPPRDGELSDHSARLRRLNEDLERAIGEEEYERAADLRDRIRDLEAAPANGDDER